MARYTRDNFVARARELHGDKYSYKRVDYQGNRVPVIIGCRTCRTWFEQAPCQHVLPRGCRKCGGAAKATTEEFIEKAREVHGDLYDYSEVVYENARFKKVKIHCNECDADFMQIPNSHLNGSGCPHCCRPHAHSKSSIIWLEHEAKTRRIKIRHARNGGEYQIPGTRLRVDGYHAKSNTVFEFHGDAYHGNPAKYKPRSRPHPYNDKTAAVLYRDTIAREELLRSLGYTVVTIWQSEYKALRKAGKIKVSPEFLS